MRKELWDRQWANIASRQGEMYGALLVSYTRAYSIMTHIGDLSFFLYGEHYLTSGATLFFLARLFFFWRDFFFLARIFFSGTTFFSGATLLTLFFWGDTFFLARIFFFWRDTFFLARFFFLARLFSLVLICRPLLDLL